MFNDQFEFNKKYEVSINLKETLGKDFFETLAYFRRKILEESQEFGEEYLKVVELARVNSNLNHNEELKDAFVAMLRESVDIVYMTLSMMNAMFGEDAKQLWDAVHECNMRREKRNKGEYQKKGADFIPPNAQIKEILERYINNGDVTK